MVRIARTASFASTVTLLEAKKCNDNRYEGDDGHCRGKDIFKAHGQHALLRVKRAQQALRALLPCQKLRSAMIIGMKEEMGVADVMTCSS